MTPATLRRLIAKLPEYPPVTTAYVAMNADAPGAQPPWYKSQREHGLGWLNQYHGPGAYQRKTFDHDAKFAYNHFQCPAGVLWLGEAAGVDVATVCRASRAAHAGAPWPSTQCAAIRRIIAWSEVEARLRCVP